VVPLIPSDALLRAVASAGGRVMAVVILSLLLLGGCNLGLIRALGLA
jgi:hypothetical protein